jgi:hypothetical protein
MIVQTCVKQYGTSNITERSVKTLAVTSPLVVPEEYGSGEHRHGGDATRKLVHERPFLGVPC